MHKPFVNTEGLCFFICTIDRVRAAMNPNEFQKWFVKTPLRATVPNLAMVPA